MKGTVPEGNSRFWDLHAAARSAHAADAVAALPARFEWTSQPGVGPAAELFGALPGLHVLELGCGPGDNLAYLVAHGARGTGVDGSVQQLRRARSRWAHLGPAATFVHADAARFLSESSSRVDRAYSGVRRAQLHAPIPIPLRDP